MDPRDSFLRDRMGSGAPPPPAPPGQPFYPPLQQVHAEGSTTDPWAYGDIRPVPSGPPPRPQPTRGWRLAVLRATFGLVNLGLSPAERQEAEYQATIALGFRGHYKVGVLGKGGVGKTSVAASVGSIFAQLRRADRVVAVDADTAFGRLASRIDPDAASSYWDLATDKNLQSFADITARVGNNPVGLYVLAGEPASGRRRVLDAALYREAALRLDRHFTLSIIDCGSTMDSPVTQEALRDLDALIVVSSPWADGASAAAKTMEWLAERGQTDLLQRSVVVLNDSDGHADKRTRAMLAQQFLRHRQAVVEVPFDPHLRPGGVIDIDGEMQPATRRKFLQIAAIVSQFFASRPGRPRNPGGTEES